MKLLREFDWLIAVECGSIAITIAVLLALSSCDFEIPRDINIHIKPELPTDPSTPPVTPPPVAGSLTFTADIAPILNASCVSCHGATKSGGYDFRTYETTMLAVKPGKSGDSLLCYEPEHGLMPPGGKFLPADDTEKLCDWIDDGAKK